MFGSMDLDTRPPEMQRSTMIAWIQRCPSCGYCAGDTSVFNESARKVLNSSTYRSQLVDPTMPGLGTSFACAGMLHEAAGENVEAGWAYLRTAWLCDDESQVAESISWRSRAADIFLGSMKRGEQMVNQQGGAEAIVTDCLRRAGRGDEAIPLVEQILGGNYDPALKTILAYQRTLILAGDHNVHTVSDALENK
jgi:hypothetical protein